MSSAGVRTLIDKNIFWQQYSAEWKIEDITRIKTTGIQTPPFSPIPGIDVSFCFELLYQRCTASRNYCMLVFKKLHGSDVPDSLAVKVRVEVYNSSELSIEDYESPAYEVASMTSLACMDITDDISEAIQSFYEYPSVEPPFIYMVCHIKFHGHITTPSAYHSERKSFNNLKAFVKDFSSIYDSRVLSDIVIQIGEKTLPAHKSVLAAHSPVFLKMMEGDFLESKTNSICISDTEYKTFDSFLRYLYSGDIEDKSWSNVIELYCLADKYLVQSLKRECVELIITSYLTMDYVCEILKIAFDYNDNDLKREAKSFASRYFQDLVADEKWNELVASSPLIGYEVIVYVLGC